MKLWSSVDADLQKEVSLLIKLLAHSFSSLGVLTWQARSFSCFGPYDASGVHRTFKRRNPIGGNSPVALSVLIPGP